MSQNVPRVMFAAASSGCGKTTVTCAVLQALKNRGIDCISFKCGPDYIDPMFHREALGIASRNLDLFFAKEQTVRYLLQKNSQGKDFALIEGVMGYYDGISTKGYASSWCLARATKTPTILILDCRGMSTSIAAQLLGYLSFEEQSQIRGVILNRISKGLYPEIKELIESRFTNITVCGYMPKMPDCSLESRHLGLVTAGEVANLKEKLVRLGKQAEESIDLSALLSIANTAPELSEETSAQPISLPQPLSEPVKIGVAKDKAFHFYYEDNLSLLTELGAQLIFFSPMQDSLPEDLDGLLIGGGYPEVYAQTLSQNQQIRNQIKLALQNGLPCIAECGGFQYLQEELEGEDGTSYPMVGFLKGKSFRTEGLRRFGYVNLTANEDNLLCKKGEGFPAHEFHYWDSENTGSSFHAQKPMRKANWECIVANDHFVGGYPHLYFYSQPEMAKRFLEKCLTYQKQKEGRKNG